MAVLKIKNEKGEEVLKYYEVNDSYGKGFPSRWHYVVEKLEALEAEGEIESFFSIILSTFGSSPVVSKSKHT